MSKHTQGPWSIWNDGGINNTGHYDGYLKTDIKAGSNLIHVRQSVAGNTFLELSANVRLIAAAPQMLEALKKAKELVKLITVRQVIDGGNAAIDASGLNPWCINEGLAYGNEPIDISFITAAISAAEGRE